MPDYFEASIILEPRGNNDLWKDWPWSPGLRSLSRTPCVWDEVSVSSGVLKFESGFIWFSHGSLSCSEVSKVNLLHLELESKAWEGPRQGPYRKLLRP